MKLRLLTIAVAAAAALGRVRGAERVADLSAFMAGYLGPGARKERFQFGVISDTHIGSDQGAVRNMKALVADMAGPPGWTS